MREITKTIKLYKFDELNKEAKNKAIDDIVNFYVKYTDIEVLHKNSNLYKAIKKADEMQTPWFVGHFIWEYCEKQILKDLRQYEYTENGDIYTDKTI